MAMNIVSSCLEKEMSDPGTDNIGSDEEMISHGDEKTFMWNGKVSSKWNAYLIECFFKEQPLTTFQDYINAFQQGYNKNDRNVWDYMFREMRFWLLEKYRLHRREFDNAELCSKACILANHFYHEDFKKYYDKVHPIIIS